MKRTLWKSGALLLACSLLISIRATGQDPAGAIQTTRKVADKIIRETAFTCQLVPLSFNVGITRLTIDGPVSGDESMVWYGSMTFASEKDTAGILGLSFQGRIRIFLNGAEVFQGSSPSVELQEYTYNRFRFRQRIPVRWLQGENRVLVKCDLEEGPLTLLMLPVDRLDAGVPYVSALPVSEETPLTHWSTCGPWNSAPGAGMGEAFPPEEGFREYYMNGDQVVGWNLEEVPLLRELVIPPSASYTRDAYSDWHYANGGTMLGILSLYQVTGDERYLEFVKAFAANMLENEAYFRWQYFNLHAMRGSFHRVSRMTMLDDSGGPALPFAQLQLMDPGDPGYMELLTRVFEYVMNGQERLTDGTFCRPEPEAATIWADDLFMVVPFLLRMAEVTGEQTLYDHVATQVIRFNKYLADPATGLYFHGWYNNRGENTPVRWGRANGWIVWATSEALLHLPKDHPQYRTILKIFRDHMKALAGCQDESGLWHQVLDHPETFLETSCTAMFTLGMARGVRMGWLGEKYREPALKGWQAVAQKTGEEGTVRDICRGTGIGDDVAFYETRQRFDHDPRGLGAVLTAGCEIALMGDQ